MDHGLRPLVRRPELLRMGEPFAALDFELRLALIDCAAATFEAGVRDAANAVGGSLLFEMPDSLIADGIERVAAVSLPGADRDVLVFVGLATAEQRIRLMGREEVGDRFHGFATAYLGVLKRLERQLVPHTA